MKNTIKLLLVTVSVALLTACGGGGESGGSSGVSVISDIESSPNLSDNFLIVVPTKLATTPRIGSTSFPADISDYGNGTISFAVGSQSGFDLVSVYNAATSPTFAVFPKPHLTNEVFDAWSSGWTGFGVTISIIDDFNNTIGGVTRVSPELVRTADFDSISWGKVQGTYRLTYQWTNSFSHGALVANIAGGDFDGQILTTRGVPTTIRSVARTSCTVLRASLSPFFTTQCDPDFYSGVFSEVFDVTYKKVAGVAKQSLVVNNNVNLSSRQNSLQTVADIQGHLRNSAYLGVINLSLGSDIPTSGRTFAEVMSQVSRFPLQKVDAVITVAAGNGGAPCDTENLNGCNSVAVALAYQQATAASTIVVGATSGVGSSENIATYSTRAGVLAQRFVLAPGDEGSRNIQGTSFAAPRVSGIAAILKQKYPSLTSAQIANVILLSASKDINNDGADDFTGVSPIYGHGKVSLTRALALAGSI